MSGKRTLSPAEMIKGVTNSRDSRASRPECMTPREDDDHAQDIVDREPCTCALLRSGLRYLGVGQRTPLCLDIRLQRQGKNKGLGGTVLRLRLCVD